MYNQNQKIKIMNTKTRLKNIIAVKSAFTLSKNQKIEKLTFNTAKIV